MQEEFRLFGIRPSGRIHLGHVFTIINGEPNCLLIADLNAGSTKQKIEYTCNILKKILPDNCKILIQSDYSLDLLLLKFEYERLLTIKDLMQKVPKNTINTTVKDFTYSTLMAADIKYFTSIYSNQKNTTIIVGEDQNINLEIANFLFSKLNLPKIKYMGLKTLNNLKYKNIKMSTTAILPNEHQGVIFIDDSEENIFYKIKKALSYNLNDESEDCGLKQLITFFNIDTSSGSFDIIRSLLSKEVYSFLKKFSP